MDKKLTELIEKLVEAIGLENTDNLVNICERVKARAIERDRDQAVIIAFSRKGHVDYIDGSDRVNGYKPKMYKAE